MTAAITRDGAFALKVFTDQRNGAVNRLVRLTNYLIAAGVPIPLTKKAPQLNGIRLSWIQGETMRERMKHIGFQNINGYREDLIAAMAVLHRLHSSDVPRSGLENFRPFRLADKRISEKAFQELPRPVKMDVKRLRILLDMQMPIESPNCIVHGDFHIGQLILEQESRKWWMIDLDDVAIGHCESDIANFCVNIATARSQPVDAILNQFNQLQSICRSAYGAHSQDHQVKFYAAAALLRRALKFANRGENLERVKNTLEAGITLAQV